MGRARFMFYPWFIVFNRAAMILYNNRLYSDKQSICNQLNNYFVSEGEILVAKLPASDIDPLVYTPKILFE